MLESRIIIVGMIFGYVVNVSLVIFARVYHFVCSSLRSDFRDFSVLEFSILVDFLSYSVAQMLLPS